MSVVDEVKKIDINTATAVTLFFFSVLAPGLLIMFLYKRELFVELETLKLVLLSLALGAPGVVLPQFMSTICTAVYPLKLNVPRPLFGDPKEWFFRHSISNAINMYLLIFIGYVFEFQFYIFAWVYLVSIVLLSVYEIIYLIKRGINPEKYPPIDVE
ncbi:TPA: hypothetical protein ACVOYT_004526 [Vibrio diabolicus]|uniref:Uncharacterized protein n=1 Tax=Vibrio diabolicus TaxID=50719 RepID=A0AAX1XFU8_9VIBR|nr:hypothetical protein [Vibrio diabolicus]RPB31408.1 hypothetical protein CYQ91_24375 [Vibrio diabolicus]